MKIALLGYGKMGKVIERIALERGHEIVLRKRSRDSFEGLESADVAIDFSVPEAAVANISAGFQYHVPVVSGTTGWLQHYEDMVTLCQKSNGAFIYGSNFSLGVNLFFELNAHLAKMMAKFGQYKVSMQEVHHTQKLDKPSGTAISLANGIIANTSYENWTLAAPKTTDIAIEALRVENVPGTHAVVYDSEIDSIEIKHTAHNREGFAFGAVIAAEWLLGKKGVYTMKDVLEL
ncbi:MAG: 4-hydroxy-tetrahydrodipicolinate reductase [Flavobacterium sp. BFFFF1]|uniref:4-hydroxy-tetrahydrodipicolinate reductase n=1 Tax=Flavobacterium sp. BFFFF1 TaxID=2015557 RepID=UPI000BD7AF95|nr:4-hydroxy-tetrahydrodipicolinate reductase [Flavobacterium sp. BFFFF1]OYU80531.1 MAG: 4-hydroxy-tetrahydrodipicolinate reductase [Flavobacterium sp. BFFFF1]